MTVTRLLGLDVGSVRVGVAISDPLGWTAQPLEVILRQKGDVFARINKLVETHEVGRIVVGNPLRLDGNEGPATQAVAAFVAELEKRVAVPAVLWDERLSTAQAERLMIDGGARRQKRRDNIDKVAAALILQSYLDAQPQ